jgi:DNA polymerase III sliding clamp (beta) subunit (PCNA family)
MVAYSALLLRVKGQRLRVTGSDAETTVTAAVSLSGDHSEGQALVPPKPFAGWLSKLNPQAVLHVSVTDGGDLHCEVDGAPYTFRCLTATYATPTHSRDDLPEVRGDLATLAAGVAAVRHATRDGVQIVSAGELLTLTATDNYRLAHVRLPGCGFGDREGVASLAALEAITRHGPLTHLGITQNRRELRARSERVTVSTRLLSSPFPSVASVLATEPPHSVSIERVGLVRALDRLVSVADKAHATMTVQGSQISMKVENAELGTGAEALQCSGSDQELTCGISPSYLLDAANAHTAERVTLGWSSPREALRLSSTATDGTAVICLLMPVVR